MAISIKELCSKLEVQEVEIKYLAHSRKLQYRESLIEKRSGGTRELFVPSNKLKEVQRKIVDQILLPSFNKLPRCVMGGRSGISNKDNAFAHINSEAMAKFDFCNFFTSIDSKKVFYVFRNDLGFTTKAAKLLTELTTISSRDGITFLPQGAPTSPILATLAIKKLIMSLHNLCLEHNLIFTIWIDDITISGTEADLRKTYKSAVALIRNSRIPLNMQKTTGIIKPGSAYRFVVSGINIDKGGLSIPKDLRKKIKSDLRKDAGSHRAIARLSYARSINETQVSHLERKLTNNQKSS